MTIDESLRTGGADGKARQRAAGGQALVGLRHPWNLLKHHGQRLQDLLLVNIEPDRPIVTRSDHPPRSRMIEAPVWEARWKLLGDLPTITPGSRYHQPDQEQAYVAHLEDRPVKATVEPIQTFLVGFC